MNISVELGLGELVDKLTILEIKLDQIKDLNKLQNVRIEYQKLLIALPVSFKKNKNFMALMDELRVINKKIWDIEDQIRNCEKNKDFGEIFVSLARGVYFNNDNRAKIKRDINVLCGSEIIEEKSYSEY